MFSSIFISRFMALDQSEARVRGHCGWFNMGKIGLRSLVITPCPYTTDDADPDNNFFNRLHVDSHYYTDDQFNRKCHTNAESDNFALIYYNCRILGKKLFYD